MSEEQVEAIFQHACEGAAESIGSTRVDWQRVVDAIRFLRRSRDDARKDAVACAAAHINAVAQLSEARRLLDDAREPKPVGETCFDAQGIRWYNTSDRERLPFGTKLYAAAPVPAQSACQGKNCGSMDGLTHSDECYAEAAETFSGKKPAAVPEAVAKDWVPNGWLIRPLNDGAIQVRAPDDRVEIGYRFAADSDTAQARTTYKLLAALLSAADTEVKNGTRN